jgi:hypothetical protein
MDGVFGVVGLQRTRELIRQRGHIPTNFRRPCTLDVQGYAGSRSAFAGTSVITQNRPEVERKRIALLELICPQRRMTEYHGFDRDVSSVPAVLTRQSVDSVTVAGCAEKFAA